MKRKFGILALFSVLTLIITSCGGGSTTPAPTPDFSIAVSNAAPTIVEGATTTVTVTITPTGGFSDQVALSITNPTEVGTASFNPATTTSTSVLTLGSSTAGTYSMPIAATGGGITKNTSVTLTVTAGTAPPPPATSTISGKVLNFDGQPIANAPVVVLGQDPASNTLTTTSITGLSNANGEFTIAGVKKPYDLAVISSSGGIGGNLSTIYMGLTKDDPTLFSFKPTGATPNSAKFNGNSGAKPNPVADHRHRGVFGSPEVLQSFTPNNSGNYNNINVNWFGPTTTNGMLHVLQWKKQPTSSLPLSYTGYGKRETILTDQGTANNQDITLTNLGSNNAGGSITLPTDYEIDEKSMAVVLDANSRLEFASETNTNPNFNYVTPQINGATVSVAVSTTNIVDGRESNILRTGFALDNTAINLSVPDAPELALPVNNATNIGYDTQFQWAPFGASDSVHIVALESLIGNSFVIITKDSKVKIPDLSAEGLPINPQIGPSGTPIPHTYRVNGIGPFSSVDAAASPTLLKLFSGQIIGSDMSFGMSQEHQFIVPSK